MIYTLDTNVCIRFLNGTSDNILYKLGMVSADDVALCSIVRAELLYGAAKSQRALENRSKVLQFCQSFVSLPFDDLAAETYGDIRVGLEKTGNLIGPNDLMIAAIAMANQLTLITHNVREFSRVPGLEIDDWEI